LSTPWGAQTEWSQQTLLVTLHREAWGGEKFFEMLSRISQDPGRHIDLMELQYICIALGFAGRYQVSAGGSAQLGRIQQDLYRAIRTYRGVPPSELSLRWRGVEDRRNPLIRYVPWWVVAASVLVLLAVTFTFYYARLANAAEPVLAQLSHLGLEDFNTPVAAAPVPGPTLKQLLREEEARRLVSVDEEGARTVVIPLASDLFASGSAAVNPAHRDVLARVARALNQVSGRVLVKGHTDNQPIQSLRYKNNYELSQDRAASVVKILQESVDNDSRLQSTGVGPDEPRFRPESEPENRARNRRVEIIHVSGT
jgi:type VI secretion system protein ImpK